MDERHTKLLKKNRVTLVRDLEPRGMVLDVLYEDGVLTENDLEQISNGRSRKERCQMLLAMLPTRGPSAYGSFRRALHSGQYDHLADSLENVTPDIREHLATGEICQECPRFLQTLIEQLGQFEQLGKTNEENQSQFREILKNNSCLILHNVEPNDVIDQLIQDDIISQTESEKIRACVTRRERCELLSTLLYYSGRSNLIDSLKKSLYKKYNFINEIVFGVSVNDGEHVATDIQALRKAKKLGEEDREKSTEPKDCSKDITNCKHVWTPEDSLTDIKQFETLVLPSSSLESEELSTLVNEETLVKVIHNDDTDTDEDMETLKAEGTFDKDCEVISFRSECTKEPIQSQFDGSHFGQPFDDVDGFVVYQKENVARQGTRLVPKFGPTHKSKKNAKKRSNESDSKNEADARSVGTNVNVMPINNVLPEKNERGPISLTPVNNDLSVEHERAVITKSMSNFPSAAPSKRLSFAFNYLSTLINQGDFMEFENVSRKLKLRFPKNYDLMCILGYLHASRDLYRTDFDSAKRNINSTMDLARKSSNPRYFMLELYTAKTRMYITQKKLEKLQTALDDALMILETDPVGCTGRAAGWLYINDARNVTTRLTCFNLSKPNALSTYDKLFERAKRSFQRSMTNFKKDGGKDGPFGFGYALCRLVILLLRCGDNGKTMDQLTPTEKDVNSAGQYLDHLENSDIPIPKILEMHLRLAKCDFYFRKSNMTRALEHAEMAYSLASELNMLEFKEHAYNRLSFLKSRAPLVTRVSEISEEEANRILFGESSEADTQSE